MTQSGFGLIDRTNVSREADPSVRRQTALAMLGRCAQESTEPGPLMEEAAVLVASTLHVDRYGVTFAAQENQKAVFRFGAVRSDGESVKLNDLELPAAAEESASAFAHVEQRPVVVEDLTIEMRFHDEALLKLGVSSAVVCPLAYNDRSFGSFGVYCTDPRDFTRSDELFVETVGQLLSATLARQRAETALAQQSKFLAATMDSMDSLVLVLAADGRIDRFNTACETLTGFNPGEVNGRTFSSAFLLPEEVSLVQRSLLDLKKGGGPVKFESFLLTKHGDRRRVSWTFSLVGEKDNSDTWLTGTGIDVTRQYEALERLERVEAEAEAAKRQLSALQGQTAAEADRAGADAGRERRAHRRRAYPYIQTVAPIIDDVLPDLNTFREVRCRDISPRGFSFLLPEPPSYDKLVVAFGRNPSQIYLMAKVVHVTPAKYDDRDVYSVGCMYAGRAHYD